MIRRVSSVAREFWVGFLLVLITLAVWAPVRAGAQAVSGTILGTVTDSSGAVDSRRQGHDRQRRHRPDANRHADANGEFTAPSLPTGRYTVIAELTGFKTADAVEHRARRRSARAHRSQARGRRDDRIGQRRSHESRCVQTSSSELGTTVQAEQIEALPLNGRNFVNLTRTIPGVLRGIPGANIDGAGSLAWRASASFSANGQRPRDNNYMLDGVDNNETWLQTVVIFPSVDALDEFKMQTSTYSAEFGRSLGGVVNLQIKSGTNKLRGSAFEFHPQRRVRRQQLLQQPRRPGEAGLQAESVRRHHRRRRSSRTRRSSSATIRATARRRA